MTRFGFGHHLLRAVDEILEHCRFARRHVGVAHEELREIFHGVGRLRRILQRLLEEHCFGDIHLNAHVLLPRNEVVADVFWRRDIF